MKKRKVLSILIPAYNEEDTIVGSVDGVLNADIGNYDKEIIIIDDGSKDETLKKSTEKFAKNNKVKIISHKRNMGKGFAIRTGLSHAKGNFVVIHDADLEYDPNDFNAMLNLISKNENGVVYGSRRLKKTNTQYSGLSFFMGGVTLTFITNLLFGSKITDEPTCYKMFSSDVIKNVNLKCKKFEFCPEVTAKVLKSGHAIFEVPISYHPRDVKQGKKIKLKDFFEAVWVLVKYRFVD